MSEQGAIRRPVLLLSAGLVTATIVYCAYFAYTQKSNEPVGLHRRNAVRRSRRRWRRGFPPRDLSSDPTADAIRNLNGRIASRHAYGTYNNAILFNLSPAALEQGQYDLLPQNLGPMYNDLLSARTFSDLEKVILNNHIESIFVQSFLEQEFPAGYMIGDDVESLIHALRSHGIDEEIIRIMVERFDAGKPPTPVNWDLNEEIWPAVEPPRTDSSLDNGTPWDAIDALRGAADNDGSASGWDDDDDSDPGGSQGMLDLLYHIAGEQAKREGLVHRGVECNSCGVIPIRGIRYHCVNCFDYDLCETCEAQQVHHKTHVFYKIRIPAPSRGHIKQVIPAWYPGNPSVCHILLPKDLRRRLVEANKIEETELDSLYEQYKCVAGHQFSADIDPAGLGFAIDRKSFDLYCATTSTDRPPPQNLLYDRIFAYYDANNDDLITFDEFVRGMCSWQNRTRAARVKRMFDGYDIDGDGYVSRKDFLRICRAQYAWQKEVDREAIMNRAELDDDIQDAVPGTQPISAAFGWSDFAGHASRGGQDKLASATGDLEVVDGSSGVLQPNSDLRGDRARFIGDVAADFEYRAVGSRSFRPRPPRDDPVIRLPFSDGHEEQMASYLDDATEEELNSSDPRTNIYTWPPLLQPEQSDIIDALGTHIPLDEIMDPTDRARVIYSQSLRLDNEFDGRLSDARQSAVRRRWQRRQFYFDEEEGLSKPPGYTEPDSSDEEGASEIEKPDDDEALPLPNTASRRQSMRSRSSSKVRFDDSAIDTDYETRSNTSSRSIPTNERWGGFEFSEPERDIGKEILYQAVEQGFNELLDPLFKDKEEEGLLALASKSDRLKWKVELDAYESKLLSVPPDELVDSGVDSKAPAEDTSTERKKPEGAVIADHGNYTEIPLEPLLNEASSTTTGIESAPVNDSTIEIPDQTLPQHRPNDPSMIASLQRSIAGAEIKAEESRIEGNALNTTTHPTRKDQDDNKFSKLNATTTTPSSLSSPPSEQTLQNWLEHNATDAEALVRGGYGRLSFAEFKQRMMQKSIFTESASKTRLDTGGEGEDDENEVWNSTGDLGRLSFLGTWLETAQF